MMQSKDLAARFEAYSDWRRRLSTGVSRLHEWLSEQELADGQADLTVHGGKDKAVYCYPLAHYDYWKRELPGRELPAASFGENFTTDGLLEDSTHIGDKFSIGSA